jgi:hypothetical protein
MIYLSKAIRELAPDAAWSIIEGDLDNIIWHSDDIAQPSKAAILAKAAEIEAQEEVEKHAAEAAKQSGMAKLAAIGLTPDEIKSLLGV